MAFRSAIVVLSLVAGVIAQQCETPTVTTQYGAVTTVVSSGTLATILPRNGGRQRITVTSCAQATVLAGATATVAGGTIYPGPIVGDPTGNDPAAYPVVTASGPNNLVTRGGRILLDMAPSATLTVRSVEYVTLDGRGSYADVQADYVDIAAYGTFSAVVTATAGILYAQGSGVNIDIDFGNEEGAERDFAEAHESATLTVRGRSVYASADSGAHITMYGLNNFGAVDADGFLTASGARGQYFVTAGGYAEVVAGSSNYLDLQSPSATGVIGGQGSNGRALSGAQLEVRALAGAEIRSGATATIFSDVGEVTASNGAIVTMYAGATITAGPEAVLRVLSPSTSIVSLDTIGTDTIFAARTMASAQPGRRSVPVPTGLCRVGSQSCPNLRGVFRCVDVTSDIFNCGGCALSSDPGVDCTEIFESGVKCIAGRCVAT